MASPTDILTTLKNIVTAISNAAQTYLNVQGALSYSDISTASLIHTGPGRVCNVIVTTAGTTTGSIYDANSAAATTNKVYVIPNTVGVYVVNFPINYGIVVAPGTGQVVSISHS